MTDGKVEPTPGLPDSSMQRMTRVARALTLALATAAIGVYVYVALARMTYPFELEWLEGGSLVQIERIRAGQGLYVPPGLEFTPFIYTPGYFQAASWLAPFAEGFVPMRALSFAASLAAFALVFAFASREAGDWKAGLCAAGLLAATFEASGGWFDLARVDSLFLALALGPLLLLRPAHGLAAGVAAGILAALAFFTKQTALVMLAPFVVWSLVERRRAGLAFVATFAVLVAVGVALLDASSEGWSSYYVFELPRRHPIVWPMLPRFWVLDLGACVPIAYLFAGGWLVYLWRTEQRERLRYSLCVLCGTVGAALLGRMHAGGASNVVMPAYAGVAMLGALGMSVGIEAITRRRWPAAPLLVPALCIAQLGILAYDPRDHLPHPRSAEAGRRLVETIRKIDGDVWVVHHSYLPSLAGKRSAANYVALKDLLRSSDRHQRSRLDAEIRRVVRSRRYAAIVLDGVDWYPELMTQYYERPRMLLVDPDVLWTPAGKRVRPYALYVRRGNPSPAVGSGAPR